MYDYSYLIITQQQLKLLALKQYLSQSAKQYSETLLRVLVTFKLLKFNSPISVKNVFWSLSSHPVKNNTLGWRTHELENKEHYYLTSCE